jgi:hypothetical protein
MLSAKLDAPGLASSKLAGTRADCFAAPATRTDMQADMPTMSTISLSDPDQAHGGGRRSTPISYSLWNSRQRMNGRLASANGCDRQAQ